MLYELRFRSVFSSSGDRGFTRCFLKRSVISFLINDRFSDLISIKENTNLNIKNPEAYVKIYY